MIRAALGFIGIVALAGSGCTTGEGSGSVTSERLYVENCWNGEFDLKPTFFGTTPFEDTQEIRVQRGDRLAGVSDGVMFNVTGVQAIRAAPGEPVAMGLPIGVRPPGFPVIVQSSPPPDSMVSMTLYLNESCHVQNSSVYSVSGSITFESLFSGDRNEDSADARLTSAKFEVDVADPRDGIPGTSADAGTGQTTITYPPEKMSHVTGNFQFFFQRGVPAQPFP